MHKNQLQELAQRSCFNLPAYSCIREGPDHAPRFKATVNFNGEIFESPGYFGTLRQAEHAAAEVALNVLSTRGPSQSLAAQVLDETGVCKNLLQETAQRVGVSLPMYTTIKGGPGHNPVFSCIVEVGGRVFAGEPAKTKKQAEKNAAMAAWSVVKQYCEASTSDELEGRSSTGIPTLYKRDDRSQQMQSPSRFSRGRPRVRMANEREGHRLSREGSPARQFYHRRGSPASSPASSPSGERRSEAQWFLFNQQPSAERSDLARSGRLHQRSHSLTGIDSSMLSQQESVKVNKGSASGGAYLARAPLLRQYQSRPSRLSLHSSSDRFELRRPFMYELELLEREGDDEWLNVLANNTAMHLQPQQQQQQQQQSGNVSECGNPHLQNRRALFQSQSERFELKPSVLDELYQRDEEDWWFKAEMMRRKRDRFAVYECRDKGTYGFYDRNKGSFTGTENISFSSGFNSDLSNTGNVYTSGYRDVVGTSYGDYGADVTQKGAVAGYSAGYSEELALPSSYTGFNTASPKVSIGGERGSGSYSTFNVSEQDESLFSNDVSQSVFSGYPNRESGSRNVNDDEEHASSSASVWSRPAQQLTSQSPFTTSSAVAHSLGIRPASSLGIRSASSIAPPVRVRQTVAVCSAPPPRSMAVEDHTLTNYAVTQSLYHGTSSLDRTSSINAETTTEDLFNQLRL